MYIIEIMRVLNIGEILQEHNGSTEYRHLAFVPDHRLITKKSNTILYYYYYYYYYNFNFQPMSVRHQMLTSIWRWVLTSHYTASFCNFFCKVQCESSMLMLCSGFTHMLQYMSVARQFHSDWNHATHAKPHSTLTEYV